jgi:rRNA maturation protein Nop10
MNAYVGNTQRSDGRCVAVINFWLSLCLYVLGPTAIVECGKDTAQQLRPLVPNRFEGRDEFKRFRAETKSKKRPADGSSTR